MLNHMYKHMIYFYNLMYYNWSQNVPMDICLGKKVWEARYGSDPAIYYTNKHRHQYQKVEIKHITEFVWYIGRVVENTVCFHYAGLLYTTYIWFIFAFFRRLWLWPTRIVIFPSWEDEVYLEDLHHMDNSHYNYWVTNKNIGGGVDREQWMSLFSVVHTDI